jgi:hypothetical protein
MEMHSQVLGLTSESPKERTLTIISVGVCVDPEVIVDMVCFSQELNPGFYPTVSLVSSNVL